MFVPLISNIWSHHNSVRNIQDSFEEIPTVNRYGIGCIFSTSSTRNRSIYYQAFRNFICQVNASTKQLLLHPNSDFLDAKKHRPNLQANLQKLPSRLNRHC